METGMNMESIDLERIRLAVAAERREQETRGPLRTSVDVAVRTATTLILVVFILPVVTHWDLTRLTGLTTAAFLRRASVILVVTLLLTGLDRRKRQRMNAEDTSVAAQRIANEVTSLTGPDWWLRVLRWGAATTAGVGIPVGLLLAIKSPSAELPSGGRVEQIIMFLLLTGAWALPAAFGIRWMVLKSYRRMYDERPA